MVKGHDQATRQTGCLNFSMNLCNLSSYVHKQKKEQSDIHSVAHVASGEEINGALTSVQ